MKRRSILLIVAVGVVGVAALTVRTMSPHDSGSDQPAPVRRFVTDQAIPTATRADLVRWAKARPPQARPGKESLSVTFALEDGNTVTLDYIDAHNYRFTTQNNAFQTYILDSKIYLYAPADSTQPEQLWLYGRLDDPRSQAKLDTASLDLKPTSVPPAGVAAWGNIGAVSDVRVSQSGPFGIPVDVTIANTGQLAHAQWSIASLLLPAMDMSLCGDGVQAVTTWWPKDLTGAGLAIVATTAGVRLDGPIRASSGPLTLPGRTAVQIHPLARL